MMLCFSRNKKDPQDDEEESEQNGDSADRQVQEGEKGEDESLPSAPPLTEEAERGMSYVELYTRLAAEPEDPDTSSDAALAAALADALGASASFAAAICHCSLVPFLAPVRKCTFLHNTNACTRTPIHCI